MNAKAFTCRFVAPTDVAGPRISRGKRLVPSQLGCRLNLCETQVIGSPYAVTAVTAPSIFIGRRSIRSGSLRRAGMAGEG